MPVSPAIIKAFAEIDRSLFIHSDFMDHATKDTALPIQLKQTISQPSVMAQMMQLMDILPHHKILEIGTGSGYQAAILAKLAKRIYSMERIRELWQLAEANFKKCKIRNITTRYADGAKGWAEVAPFDRIILSASCNDIPDILTSQLNEGGILIMPLGRHVGQQQLITLHKNNGIITRTEHGMVKFVPLLKGIQWIKKLFYVWHF